jgi:hypothetical protein
MSFEIDVHHENLAKINVRNDSLKTKIKKENKRIPYIKDHLFSYCQMTAITFIRHH